jgi:hypothetical protein
MTITTADEEVDKENPLEHLLGVNHTKYITSTSKDRDKDKEY